MEVIGLLKPVRSVYIPHDLTQPLIAYEDYFLSQFDLFLSPCEPFTSAYASFCKTEEVGWAKYKKSVGEKSLALNKAIWLLSDFILHIKMGKEKSFRFLESILAQGVAIKFPYWPGSDSFEKFFSNQGVKVYPAAENSIELILGHQIIITNGLSSIIAESYFLGKPTVNIIEGSHYGKERLLLSELFPDLLFVEKIKDFKLKNISIKNRQSILKPLNMKKAISLITAGFS